MFKGLGSWGTGLLLAGSGGSAGRKEVAGAETWGDQMFDFRGSVRSLQRTSGSIFDYQVKVTGPGVLT